MKKTELKKLLKEWAKYTTSDQTSENIDKGNEALIKLEENLPFKCCYEKERWQDYASWFTCFEDFYNFTLAIIDKKDYFIQKEQYELNCDENGYSNTSCDKYIHCEWCGDIDVIGEGFKTNLGYLCGNCIDYLKTQGERLRVYYNED